MPFCGACGAQVEGKFCPKCGAAVGSATAPPPGGAGTSPLASGMQDNVASALCYALGFITGIIFLVLEPYSKNRAIRFHAFQSIFMNVALFAVQILLSVLFSSMFAWGLYYTISSLFSLLCFALWIYLMYSAYQGNKLVLPVIGDLAEKQAQA